MTGTRVLTALVLIPIVIAIVLFTPTWAVAIALALITILALREYFALGDAIGHRAYYLWTVFCSLLLIAQQTHVRPAYGGLVVAPNLAPVTLPAVHPNPTAWLISPVTLFFLFVLGLTVLTLFTRRPL